MIVIGIDPHKASHTASALNVAELGTHRRSTSARCGAERI